MIEYQETTTQTTTSTNLKFHRTFELLQATLNKSCQVCNPIEAFVEEYYNDPTLKQKLDQALENRELPPNYLSHPVVVQAPPGSIVLPGALYVDGMPFVRHDGLIGFWTYCM